MDIMTPKKFSAVALACTALIAAALGQTSTSVSYEYAKLAYPGAILTLPNGINNGNVIVGSYFDSSGNEHGFIYRQGRYTPVNFPGATETEVMGINDAADIVGVYQLQGPLNFHGFLRHNGTFLKINVPAAQFGTRAFAINQAGTIVGSYDDAHGFIFRNGKFQTFDAPQQPGEPPQTQLNGINNYGWIAGQVFTGGIWRGFWVHDKDLDFLEPPGKDSQVMGINGRGDIVGCHDSNAGFVSFNVEQGEGSEKMEKFPRQQKLASCVTAINFSRAIVGSYFTVKQPYGFVAVPALTLKVTAPANASSQNNPVQITAFASGIHPVAQIQVWMNSTEIFHVNEARLNRAVNLPVGSNERFVVQAVDSTHRTTKVIDTISVNP
jgi:uncharacterized membrane protein